MCQNLQVQVKEIKSVNESLNLSVEELYKACAFAEAILRERDEMIFAQSEKIRLLEEQCEPFYEVHSKFDSEIVLDTQDNSGKDLILSLQTQVKETAELIVRFSNEKYFALKEIECLKDEIKSLPIKNQDLKPRESESNNLEKVYSVKEYELLEKIEQMRSQVSELLEKLKISDQEIKIVLLQKENNNLRTSYNMLKEKYETSYEKLEKENNDLKMHYKRLFDSIKRKKVVSQVFTKSIPKVNVSKKIYTGKSSKPISKKVSQFTTYSLQKDRKYLKKQW
uniref:Pyruvate, phosphate dikinase regulatory protein, chloroplastic n=1 Tax=Tanacetum cinerariifolium TaxID=118510 RepID=A0A6L2K7B0_TANCI|nr:hypothetical protein [Tanacetum cinerariifolium]